MTHKIMHESRLLLERNKNDGLTFSVQSVEFTIRSSTRDASEALKLFTTEGI